MPENEQPPRSDPPSERPRRRVQATGAVLGLLAAIAVVFVLITWARYST